jgi:hypothetical protein
MSEQQFPHCPICGESLNLSLARGRKSGKPFLMLRCLVDGRHFRGFITHRPFVESMLNKIEALKPANPGDSK